MPRFNRVEYTALPAQQTVDYGPVDGLEKPPRRSKASLFTLFSALFVILVVAGLGTAVLSNNPTSATGPRPDYSKASHGRLARETGDQYLLGVGKADITG